MPFFLSWTSQLIAKMAFPLLFFWKPKFTGLFTNFDSLIPQSFKRDLVLNQLNGYSKICSSHHIFPGTYISYILPSLVHDTLLTYISLSKNYFAINAYTVVHLLLFITRKYTIINADPKLLNPKIHSFYLIDIH